MTAVGPTAFGLLLWGGILGTAAVFLYEVSVLLQDLDAADGG